MGNYFKLTAIKSGCYVVVNNVLEMEEKLKFRLCELGFVKNQKIQVVKNLKKSKTMIVNIRGCVLAIDYGVAELIVVKGD